VKSDQIDKLSLSTKEWHQCLNNKLCRFVL